MGNFLMAGFSTSEGSLVLVQAQIGVAGGVIFGILIILVLIVIAGFLIMKYRNKEEEIDEDREIGINKGIAKKRIDN